MSGAIRYLANATLEGSHLVRHHPGKPNVIVFFTDQQRWDSTGLHGNPLELTPNLDRVARAERLRRPRRSPNIAAIGARSLGGLTDAACPRL